MAQITLFQVNDTHAYLEPHPEVFYGPSGPVYHTAGGYSRLAGILQQARSERPGRVALLDNGDTFHGTYAAVQTGGEAMVPILNALGPEAMTLHWEFAYGPQGVQRLAEGLQYPLLAANIYRPGSEDLFLPPTHVFEIGGLRLGVVGLASNIVDKTMPPHFSQGLRFNDGRAELPGLIERLRQRERVDLVVLLSHLGFPQDLELLAETPGVDVCLSGHTHNRLERPVVQNGAIVIQSGSHGSFLGRLDLEVQSGRVTGFSHRLIEVAESAPVDPQVEDLVQAAVAPYRAELQEVVGETTSALDRGFNLETTMDNLLLQALLDATGARLAFSNGWRYGAPVLPGPVTRGDLFNIIPVNPPLTTVDLRGDELWAMLEENLEHTYSRQPFDQMGGYLKRALGLTAYFKVENPPGQRLQKLFVGQEEVRPQAAYPAVFVTEQGVPARYGSNRQKLDIQAVPALEAYLRSHSPVTIHPYGTFRLV